MSEICFVRRNVIFTQYIVVLSIFNIIFFCSILTSLNLCCTNQLTDVYYVYISKYIYNHTYKQNSYILSRTFLLLDSLGKRNVQAKLLWNAMHCHFLMTRLSVPRDYVYLYISSCLPYSVSVSVSLLFPFPFAFSECVRFFLLFSTRHSISLIHSPTPCWCRCQYLTWFLFYPIYLFIIHFRNHFHFFDYSTVHRFIRLKYLVCVVERERERDCNIVFLFIYTKVKWISSTIA